MRYPLPMTHYLDGPCVPATPWILLHAGVITPSRRHRISFLAEVVRLLSVEEGVTVVFCGTDEEVGTVEAIASECRVPIVSFAGTLSPDTQAALIETAPLLISNHTGLASVAMELGTPVVDLFAPRGEENRPRFVPERVFVVDIRCAGCPRSEAPLEFEHCTNPFEPHHVVKAVVDILRARP